MNRPSTSSLRGGTAGLALAIAIAAPAAAQTLTIADAAEAAVRTHPTLQAAAARVDAAEQSASAVRAARRPAFGLTAGLTRFEEPMVVAPLHAFDPTRPPGFDKTLVQGQAGISYTVFDGGAGTSRVDGAGALADAAAFGQQATQMALLEQVASAFLGTLSARAVRDAAEAQASAVAAEATRAQRHFDAGTAAEVEVLRARAALQDARAQQATAAARVGLAERSLARTMGIPAAEIQGRPLSDLTATGGASGGSAAGSPVVSRAASFIGAADARLAEQRSGRLPKLDIRAGILDFGTLDNDHVTEWQAGIQLSWPVFTGGARKAGIRRAEADVRAARSDLAATELQVESAIDAAATAVAEAVARAEALEAAVTQWTEVARIEALSVDAGSGVQSDLLRAEAGLFQARAGFARARYDAVAARVALAHANGTLDMNWMNAVLENRQ